MNLDESKTYKADYWNCENVDDSELEANLLKMLKPNKEVNRPKESNMILNFLEGQTMQISDSESYEDIMEDNLKKLNAERIREKKEKILVSQNLPSILQNKPAGNKIPPLNSFLESVMQDDNNKMVIQNGQDRSEKQPHSDDNRKEISETPNALIRRSSKLDIMSLKSKFTQDVSENILGSVKRLSQLPEVKTNIVQEAALANFKLGRNSCFKSTPKLIPSINSNIRVSTDACDDYDNFKPKKHFLRQEFVVQSQSQSNTPAQQSRYIPNGLSGVIQTIAQPQGFRFPLSQSQHSSPKIMSEKISRSSLMLPKISKLNLKNDADQLKDSQSHSPSEVSSNSIASHRSCDEHIQPSIVEARRKSRFFENNNTHEMLIPKFTPVGHLPRQNQS